MLLSELDNKLKNNKEELQDVEVIYGIECDTYVVPNSAYMHFRELSFKSLPDEYSPELVDDDTIDNLMQFSKKIPNCNIILEVPCDSELDVGMLVNNAFSIGFEIAFIPPKGTGEETKELWEKYTQMVVSATDKYFEISRNNKSIYPIVSYFEYMVLEHHGYTPDNLATDPYIIERYVDGVDVESMDEFKVHLREKIIECLAESLGTTKEDALSVWVGSVTKASRKLLAQKFGKEEQK